ncbi:MAG: o-succinylbenzoate synthase, partial [Chloroflexota bacterium]|nr:o-succinylbenzoate synthase [Chloroflexota bacterium]
MRLERAELRLVTLPLRYPFETSFGIEEEKHCVLLRLDCEGATGWGECVAMNGPWYSEETTGTAWHILTEFMMPLVLGRDFDSAWDLLQPLARVRGNNMARAALEGAFLDALARSRRLSLAHMLGGERTAIESGVSIGIQQSPTALLKTVERELAAGYRRAKLKIKPGADIEFVRAVRHEFPEAQLMVDANSAYTLDDLAHLRALDAFGLTMIEQPLSHDDIVDHATLAAKVQTPICLDESIHSTRDARHALDLASCRIINIKAGRVGGLTEAIRIHDLCR